MPRRRSLFPFLAPSPRSVSIETHWSELERVYMLLSWWHWQPLTALRSNLSRQENIH